MAEQGADTGRDAAVRNRDRVWAVYQQALADFAEVQAALAARILAGEDTTPEQALRDEEARRNLENARALLWALPRT